MNPIPDEFTVIVTEEDRQAAGQFSDRERCLLTTTLRRNGYEGALMGVCFATIGSNLFDATPTGTPALFHYDTNAQEAPFYGPQVVGLEMSFKRCR